MTEEEKMAIDNSKKLVRLRKNKSGDIKHDTCICSTRDLDTILNLIQKLQEENKKKDKITDEMAEFIDNNLKDCLLNILKEKGCCEDTDRFKTCKDCVKQYFERKGDIE